MRQGADTTRPKVNVAVEVGGGVCSHAADGRLLPWLAGGGREAIRQACFAPASHSAIIISAAPGSQVLGMLLAELDEEALTEVGAGVAGHLAWALPLSSVGPAGHARCPLLSCRPPRPWRGQRWAQRKSFSRTKFVLKVVLRPSLTVTEQAASMMESAKMGAKLPPEALAIA